MNPSDPPRQHLPVAYGQLSYVEEGAGQPIVLVHGLPGSVRDFRYLAPHLRAHARVLRLELPGFGESTPPAFIAQKPHVRAQYILDFVEGLDLQNVILVGHSMGGALVCEAVLAAPERFSALGFLASVGPKPHFHVPSFLAFSKLCQLEALHPLLLPLLRWAYIQMGFSKRLSPMDLLRSTLDAPTISFARHRQNLHQLAQMDLPSLVAWAKDDALISDEIFEHLSHIAPNGPRMRYPNGGHNIQKTHAEDVAKHLLSLLDH